MNICLFQPDELNKSIPLRDERVQHLIKVLHKKQGDNFFAGVVEGDAGTATITRIGNKTDDDGGTVDFNFTADDKHSLDRSKPLLPITLIVGFPRPIQLRRLLRDVAGIGCETVHLTGTELGDKNYMKSTLVERGAAEQMLYDGTVQAGSTHIPKLEMHKSLTECLDCICGKSSGSGEALANGEMLANGEASVDSKISVEAKNNLLIALDNVRPTISLIDCLNLHKDLICVAAEKKHHVVLAIGSERGWTEQERDLLCKSGFTLCGMGERVLRTETAATAAVAITAAMYGTTS